MSLGWAPFRRVTNCVEFPQRNRHLKKYGHLELGLFACLLHGKMKKACGLGLVAVVVEDHSSAVVFVVVVPQRERQQREVPGEKIQYRSCEHGQL